MTHLPTPTMNNMLSDPVNLLHKKEFKEKKLKIQAANSIRDVNHFTDHKLKYSIQNHAKVFEDINMIDHANIAENKTTSFITVPTGKVPNIEDTQI